MSRAGEASIKGICPDRANHVQGVRLNSLEVGPNFEPICSNAFSNSICDGECLDTFKLVFPSSREPLLRVSVPRARNDSE